MGEFDESTHNGTTYRYYVGPEPTIAFGDGLSYTSFAYAWASSPPATIAPCDAVSLVVNVTNTGAATSDEVVQVYAEVPDAALPAPNVRLVAFERIRDVAPGATTTVTLTVSPESHASVDPDPASVYNERLVVETGRLVLSVGGGQPGRAPGVAATVNVTSARLLGEC